MTPEIERAVTALQDALRSYRRAEVAVDDLAAAHNEALAGQRAALHGVKKAREALDAIMVGPS
jgi:predicted RNase H-like nuclease